jgi:nitrate/TMAO reductase-like tetraheme cytochrome c subunit
VQTLFSKVNPYLLSEVMILILTKPSGNKLINNPNSLEFEKSCDFMDICFYLKLQDIPKVQIKNIESDENKSKIYHIIVKSVVLIFTYTNYLI